MKPNDAKYWYEQCDRIGLFVVGIFLGGMIEAIGIPQLAIFISVAIVIPLLIIMKILRSGFTGKVSK